MRYLVSLLTEIKLKANFCRLTTDDRVIDEGSVTVPNITTLQVIPSATVTRDGALCDWKLDRILVLPVMWLVAPQLIANLFKEERRHVCPDSTRVVTEEDS